MMVQQDATRLANEKWAVTKKFYWTFFAREEEQPFQRQFNLDLDLLFNTIDEALLRPDRRHHAGVFDDIVVCHARARKREISKGTVRTTSAEGSSGEGLRRDAQNTSQARARE